MAPTERDPLDRFNDYLDGLARGREAEERPGRSQDSPDSALSDVARQLRSLDAALAPDPALANRIWEDIMRQAEITGASPLHLTEPAPFAPNGYTPSRSWRIPPAAPGRQAGPRWAVTHLATALLLLVTLLAAYVALRPDNRASAPRAVTALPALTAPAPPAQPATGPGGADYRFTEVVATDRGGGGKEAEGYWLFEPAESGPEPLPVVLFLHEQGEGQPPDSYRAWIDHLVRRGAIVVYPSQISMFGQTGPAEALRNVQAAVRSALTELGTGEHAQPAPERFTVVGHGPGATLGLDYSAAATAAGLPAPGAVLAAFPSGSAQENLAGIGAGTRVVVVAGSGDLLNEDPARRLWAALTALPADQRAYVRLDSDDHGDPLLEVWHYTPMASAAGGSAVIDALDWYGTWKFLDGLMQCAFAGQWCEYALGNTPEQRFMGTWSDGVPVAEARVLDEPGTPAPS